MSYTINGKVYTDHSLMDEIVYNVKIILRQITLKNEIEANENETETSIVQGDYYVAIKKGTFTFASFPFTTQLLQDYRTYVSNNVTDTTLKANILAEFTDGAIEEYVDNADRDAMAYTVLTSNGSSFDLRADVLAFCEKEFVSNYEEQNNYYRMLHGLPDYNTTAYDIYVDGTDSRFASEDNTADIDFTLPIHKYDIDQVNALDALGVLDDIKADHTGSHYRYLDHLGGDSVDIYTARIASNWDILSMPGVNQLVKERFKELYVINRDIYTRRTYQLAYKYESDYYDEIMMILILCQTYTDMITDIPEWYIRRDVIDLRTAQYFLEAQGIKFFKQIPLKYQVLLVKNINKLIRYKSTSKNIEDIIDIFNLSGVDVYKYYLYRKFLYKKTTEDVNITYHDWEMSLTIGAQWFGNEDLSKEEVDAAITSDQATNTSSTLYWDGTEFVTDTDGTHKDNNPYCVIADAPTYIDKPLDNASRKNYLDTETFDFGAEEDQIDTSADIVIDAYIYEFGNLNASDVVDSGTTDEAKEHKEANKIVTDIYNNVYELEFVKAPLEDSYDKYVANDLYQIDYDSITYDDEYWDGEDVHSLVKNRILAAANTKSGYNFITQGKEVKDRDFTIQGTKYMSLSYKVDLHTYMIQMCYFLGLLSNSNLDTTDISIAVPSIKANTTFKVSNLLLLLYALSAIYLDRAGYLQTPKGLERTTAKPDFDAYQHYNGGRPWNGTDPNNPKPVVDPDWAMDLDTEGPYDYGDEDATDSMGTNGTYYIDLPVKNPARLSFINDTYYDYGYEKGGAKLIPDGATIHDYDFGEIGPFTPSKTITVNATNDKWIIGTRYDFGRDDPFYVEPTANWLYDNTDFDFGDEESRTEYTPGVNTRYYDFQNEDYEYIYTAVPEDPPVVVDHYWDNLEKGTFTDDLNCGHVRYYKDANGNLITADKLEAGGKYTAVDPQDMYRRDINGGDKRYSELNHQSFYEWMRWDNPQLFIPTTGRIYSFNMVADLTDVAKNIGVRHSKFGFENGYTLSDLGLDSFITSTKIDTMEDLLKTYRTNLACYTSLTKLMEDPASRDEMVTYTYAFNELFTKPFDYKYYTGTDGNVYETYLAMLKDKDYTLYRYYKSLAAEKDAETRKDNIRNALNDIGETLDYYISGDNTQYIMSFLPTQSFDALLEYINLVVNFLKSWKVYFLSPAVQYDIGNRLDDKATGMGDMVTELKNDIWQDERDNIRDNVYYSSVSMLTDNDAANTKEVVDMYGYHISDLNDINIDGGQVDKVTSAPRFAANILGVASNNEENEVDGGNIGKTAKSAPYNVIDGGAVDARLDIYNIDGGGALPMQYYLDIDGYIVTDMSKLVPHLADYSIPLNNIDGGFVSAYYRENKGIILKVENSVISMSLRLANYDTNKLTIDDTGLYMEDKYADLYLFISLQSSINSLLSTLKAQCKEYKEAADIFNNPALLDDKIRRLTNSEIGNAITAFKEVNAGTEKDNLITAANKDTYDLRRWYVEEACPFGWGTF